MPGSERVKVHVTSMRGQVNFREAESRAAQILTLQRHTMSSFRTGSGETEARRHRISDGLRKKGNALDI
jgi:hypothetical protein